MLSKSTHLLQSIFPFMPLLHNFSCFVFSFGDMMFIIHMCMSPCSRSFGRSVTFARLRAAGHCACLHVLIDDLEYRIFMECFYTWFIPSYTWCRVTMVYTMCMNLHEMQLATCFLGCHGLYVYIYIYDYIYVSLQWSHLSHRGHQDINHGLPRQPVWGFHGRFLRHVFDEKMGIYSW